MRFAFSVLIVLSLLAASCPDANAGESWYRATDRAPEPSWSVDLLAGARFVEGRGFDGTVLGVRGQSPGTLGFFVLAGQRRSVSISSPFGFDVCKLNYPCTHINGVAAGREPERLEAIVGISVKLK